MLMCIRLNLRIRVSALYRRAKNVVLTAEGLALIESQNRFRESLEERFLEPLSEEERRTFHELLARVGSNICKEAGRE